MGGLLLVLIIFYKRPCRDVYNNSNGCLSYQDYVEATLIVFILNISVLELM